MTSTSQGNETTLFVSKLWNLLVILNAGDTRGIESARGRNESAG